MCGPGAGAGVGEGDGARGGWRSTQGRRAGGFVGHVKENQGSSGLEDTDSTGGKV